MKKYLIIFLSSLIALSSCGGKDRNNKVLPNESNDSLIETDSLLINPETTSGLRGDSIEIPKKVNKQFEDSEKEFYGKKKFTFQYGGNYYAEGKFDGENEDRIAIFPVAESEIKDAEWMDYPDFPYDRESWRGFEKLILLSEMGTVSPLIISDLDGMQTSLVTGEGKTLYSEFALKKAKAKKGENPGGEGITILFDQGEDLCVYEYTYYYKEGKWVNTSKKIRDMERYL